MDIIRRFSLFSERLLLDIHCPRFYEDMPTDDDDREYVACCIVSWALTSNQRGHQIVRGKKNAYITAL